MQFTKPSVGATDKNLNMSVYIAWLFGYKRQQGSKTDCAIILARENKVSNC